MMKHKTIWDPLRKKEVALTPEENVRQWFISKLHTQLGVPMHMMMSEAGFSLGEKKFRADILIFGKNASPVAVVECKRPETVIDSTVLDQAIRYNMKLSVNCIFITNGNTTYVCRRIETGGAPKYEFTSHAPNFEEMQSPATKEGLEKTC